LFVLSLAKGDSPSEMLTHGLSVLAVVASVLIHEYGHALMARRLLVPVQDIQIRTFYGVARIGSLANAKEEGLVAITGPIFNLAIAAMLLPLVLGGSHFRNGLPIGPLGIAFASNAAMGLLNLLPGLPLDGGRVLRAVLTPRFGYDPASKCVLSLGLLIGIAALFVPIAMGFEMRSIPFAILGLAILILLASEAYRENLRREGLRLGPRLSDRIDARKTHQPDESRD
jgi:stage IV sporulation protein FB